MKRIYLEGSEKNVFDTKRTGLCLSKTVKVQFNKYIFVSYKFSIVKFVKLCQL